MAVDDQYTVSLLHFDKDFSDVNDKIDWTDTKSSIDTAQPKFGTGCLHVGNSGQLRATNSELLLGTGDFTIDFWMYSTTGGGGFSTVTYNDYDGVMFNGDIVSIGVGAAQTGGTLFLVKQWAHYAIVRKGDMGYCFVNGVLKYSFKGTNRNLTSSTIAINNRYTGFNDYIQNENYYDEFRISKVARWTTDFTPPTAPYSPGVSIGSPRNLTATANDSQVTLSWNGVTGATGYNVRRSTTAGGPYTTIASNVTGTSYVDTAVTNGIGYYYVVTAVDSSGNESANSNEASATPMAPVQTGQALLRVTMIDSSEREYELSVVETDGFIIWYNSAISTGKPCFMLNKKVGSQSSKEYLAFEKIISFEVIPLTK